MIVWELSGGSSKGVQLSLMFVSGGTRANFARASRTETIQLRVDRWKRNWQKFTLPRRGGFAFLTLTSRIGRLYPGNARTCFSDNPAWLTVKGAESSFSPESQSIELGGQTTDGRRRLSDQSTVPVRGRTVFPRFRVSGALYLLLRGRHSDFHKRRPAETFKRRQTKRG